MHESRILGQWSNPVSGSRKSQAKFSIGQTAQSYVPLWINHIQGWKNVRKSYSRALEQGTLVACKVHSSKKLHSQIRDFSHITVFKRQRTLNQFTETHKKKRTFRLAVSAENEDQGLPSRVSNLGHSGSGCFKKCNKQEHK